MAGVTVLSHLLWELGLVGSCCLVLTAPSKKNPQVEGTRNLEEKDLALDQGTAVLRAAKPMPSHTGVLAGWKHAGTAYLWEVEMMGAAGSCSMWAWQRWNWSLSSCHQGSHAHKGT